jgi:ribose-phosphate pyrophosphokinase
MIEPRAPLLFAPAESRELAAHIGGIAALELSPLEERDFGEGEFKLRPLVSVRDRTVFVVQTLAPSADASVAQRFVRLLFLLFGLAHAGAARTIALVPYLSYARKDRRTQPRDPVSTRYVAQLLEATGVARLVALDVHNPAALDNAFRIAVDHLSALPLFVRHFTESLAGSRVAVASPDIGGIKRAQIFREMLSAELDTDVDMIFVEKRRTGGQVSGGTVVGNPAGREVIVLDDLCASGGTLIRAATALHGAGAKGVHVAFTHAPLAAGLGNLAACPAISQVVLTDSCPLADVSDQSRFTVLPVAPLFGEALTRMMSGTPLVPLLKRWPPRGAE